MPLRLRGAVNRARRDKGQTIMTGSIGKAALKGATALTIAALTLGAPNSALAQDGAAAADASDGDAIIVTGSRIKAIPGFDAPNPVVAITSDTIERSGKTNLTEYLADSPALLGSTRSIDSAGGNNVNADEVGTNFLNLRNLGRDRTLVLVDGRRHVAGSPGTAAVDINTIPTDLVERVDVLTGGVGAIYGADGVSGVVNFIMKKDFDGLTLRAQNTISQRGDAGERFAAATFGKNFDGGRGNVTFAYEFNQSDRFAQTKRLNYGRTGPSYSFQRNPADGSPGTSADNPAIPDRVLMSGLRWADSSMGGAVDVNFDGIPDFTGEGGVYDRGTLVPNTAFTIGGDGTPRDSYYGDFTPFSRKHIANLLGHYEFSPAFNLYFEGKYVKSRSYTYSQPNYDFYTVLAADNYYLNQKFGDAAPIGALFSRDNFDLGLSKKQLDRDLWRGVIGANGDLSDHLHYDASFVYGRSTQKSSSTNVRIRDRYYAALDAVSDGNGGVTCRINLPGQTSFFSENYGGVPFLPTTYDAATSTSTPVTFAPGSCVPLNVLGYGSPSSAAVAWMSTTIHELSRVEQYVASASLSGDTGAFFNLPGGPVGFAVGAEYRKEKSLFVPDPLRQQGLLADYGSAAINRGGFDVKEAYGEIRLPLLADKPFAKELSLGGAVRFSDYSTVGSTTTWSVNGTYAPVADLTLRGTYSQSVRAPNISELYAGSSTAFDFVVDPCGPDRLSEGSSTRQANCTAALSALGIDITAKDPTDPSKYLFDPSGDPTSPQNSGVGGTVGGNPNLKAETAKTWTAGLVLRPSFVPGLTISADWYNINLTKAINYAQLQSIVNLCYDSATLDNQFCGLIGRSSSTGYVNSWTVAPVNVAAYKTAGLDLSIAYRIVPAAGIGTFSVRFTGNYLDKLSIVPDVGADPESQVGNGPNGTVLAYPAPRYSGNFDLTWQRSAVTLNYGINWWDKTRRASATQAAANPDYYPSQYMWYKAKWEHSLYGAVDVADNFTLYGGINNLLDTKPDVGAVAYPVDATGRSFYMGIKAKLF